MWAQNIRYVMYVMLSCMLGDARPWAIISLSHY